MQATMIDRRELGIRLHLLRWVRDWSAKEVERRSGVPEATLLRWERAVGKSYPPLDRLATLAALYEVPLGDLLDEGSDMRVRLKAAA